MVAALVFLAFLVTPSSSAAVSRPDAESLVARFEDQYQGAFRQRGWILMARLISNAKAEGATSRRAIFRNRRRKVILYTGLIRRPDVTLDVVRAVLCHEVGHHLGGEPIAQVSYYASTEGQADYWAARECLPEIFKDEAMTENPATLLDGEAMAICRQNLTDSREIRVCARVISAGLATMTELARIEKDPIPSLSTPDPGVVQTMLEWYPSKQCRLDTFVAGALKRPRPACWYSERRYVRPD